jgi:hypothetical protein
VDDSLPPPSVFLMFLGALSSSSPFALFLFLVYIKKKWKRDAQQFFFLILNQYKKKIEE